MNARHPHLHLLHPLPPLARNRPISMSRAAHLFPNMDQRIAWLRAIAFLRTRTTRGWLYDQLPHDPNEEAPE